MKGMELPLIAIVTLVLAAIVLLALGAFFITETGSQMSQMEATKIATLCCQRYACNQNDAEDLWKEEVMNIIKQEDEYYKKCFQACQITYGVEKPYQCIQACGSHCDLGEEDLINRLIEENAGQIGDLING